MSLDQNPRELALPLPPLPHAAPGLVAVAPGKAVLCGEYAVLHGAPAIAVAVDRVVRAREAKLPPASPFVAAALLAARASLEARDVFGPELVGADIDSSALYDDHGSKLGLGSSAAVTVAAAGLAWVAAGGSLDDRRALFELCDEAHARAQGRRGSGIDVAVAVWGGAIRFQRTDATVDVRPVTLPPELDLTFVFSGQSASTPDLMGRVEAAAPTATLERLAAVARRFAQAVDRDDATELLSAAADYHDGMAALGDAAGCTLVTLAHARLAALAAGFGAAAKPSGAGGGDLGVVFSYKDTTLALRAALAAHGLEPLRLDAPAPGLRLERA